MVGGKKLAIRSDYRTVLLIFEAYADPELNDQERQSVMLSCLYSDPLSDVDLIEAIEQAVWFLDGGPTYSQSNKISDAKRVMDWQQDEQMIFAAVNKVAGFEVRSTDYMHWWTFLGYFNEIGECLFLSVIGIREKRNKGKALDKAEREFYRRNKDLVDLKTRYTAEELAEQERLNSLLG